MINLLLELKWWDKSIKEINELIPLLANSNIAYVKEKIKEMIDKSFDEKENNDNKPQVAEQVNAKLRDVKYDNNRIMRD